MNFDNKTRCTPLKTKCLKGNNLPRYAPNCNNVVLEKGKRQIGINQANKPDDSFAATAHGRRICLLKFAIVLKLKDNKTENSSGEMQRLQMNPPRECG